VANEAILNLGTELVLATTASTSAISNGAYAECTQDTRTSADNPGYVLGIFEFDTAAGGFSAAPTAGARINLYEQSINSDSNDAPDVDANYRQKYLYSFPIDPADAQQYLVSPPLPINRSGAKYWVQFVDGGAGTASVDSGWELRLTPCAYGTSA